MITSYFFSSRRRHTRYWRDWSSDVCSSDLGISASRSPSVAESRITSSSSFACQISQSLRHRASASGESGSRSIGPPLPAFLVLVQLEDDVGDLWDEKLLHGEPHGVTRAGEANQELCSDGAGHGAAQKSGG